MLIKLALTALAATGIWFATQEPGSQDPKRAEPSPEEMTEMMQKMQELAAPGEQHEHLAMLVGDWDLKLEYRMGPDAPWTETTGSSTYSAMLGGRYVVEEMSSNFMGMPYEGVNILGYDNLRKKWTSSWRDSMSTWAVTSEGDAMEDGSVEFRGQMIDMVTPDGRPYRSVLRHVSETEMRFEMYDNIDGKEVMVMKIHSSRR